LAIRGLTATYPGSGPRYVPCADKERDGTSVDLGSPPPYLVQAFLESVPVNSADGLGGSKYNGQCANQSLVCTNLSITTTCRSVCVVTPRLLTAQNSLTRALGNGKAVWNLRKAPNLK
jgi:hypothetical protein